MTAKVAAPAPHHAHSHSHTASGVSAVALSGALASARRPSPWHEIAPLATSLSTPLPRRGSAPSIPGAGTAAVHTPPFSPSPDMPTTISKSATPTYDSDDSAAASVSGSIASSQAMRDWERLVATPNNDVTRHALVPLGSSVEGSPQLGPTVTIPMPKLAAERDKEGHIEYKLKLIEPSQERFERLVTQMMWRLKQGRNEAIYELGLADDGTVIGLTRAEMDASLATLERMASEVGATVLVLKEIVLTSPPDRRPDLDENGRPRKGTRTLGEPCTETKSRRERLRARREAEAASGSAPGEADEVGPPRLGSRAIIFDEADVASDSDDDRCDSVHADDDVPFAMESDSPSTNTRARSSPSGPLAADAAARAEAKRRKSAARREARRLDLLRGDGTGLPYADRSRSPVAEFIGHAPSHPSIALLPHQPARPSTLRLERTPERDNADDAFLDGLVLPLDSLSLSFADVQSASPSVSTSPTRPSVLTDGLVGSQPAGGDGTGGSTPMTHALAPLDPAAVFAPPGAELICVEALVVRKRNGNEWEYGGEDDGWGFGGGEDDGRGFGEEEEEGEGDEDEDEDDDDPWGFSV